MNKHKLLLLPVAWLLAFMAFACDPPDDDKPSSGPSKLTINNAMYDVGTALLTVQGTHLGSATQAQIQTIVVGSQRNGVALNSYTADAKPTGPDSSGIEQGKYRIKSDGTALWLRLTDRHKAALQAKPGMNKDGRKVGLLTSSGTWAGLNTAKDLTVSGNSAITRATYDVGTALLTVQGTNLGSATQAQIQTIVVDGLALSSYMADATATGLNSRGLAKGKYRIKRDGTALWLKLTDDDKATLNGKPGMDSDSLKKGLLSVGTGAWAGLNTAKDLAVSGNPPAITSATYNAVTGFAGVGFLKITGTNLPKAVTGWDFSKLTLVSGDGSKRYPLPRHSTLGSNIASGSAASATSLKITLRGSVKAEADKILVNDGDSDANGAYNLEAAAGFAGGSAEDTTNPITVIGYTASITRAEYYANTGELYIEGSGFPDLVEEWDFSKLTLVSGDGSKRYQLPKHSIGENTATGSYEENIDDGELSIILSGTVKAKAEKILVKAGVRDANGPYNLEAAAGFVPGSKEDTTNPIRVVK